MDQVRLWWHHLRHRTYRYANLSWFNVKWNFLFEALAGKKGLLLV